MYYAFSDSVEKRTNEIEYKVNVKFETQIIMEMEFQSIHCQIWLGTWLKKMDWKVNEPKLTPRYCLECKGFDWDNETDFKLRRILHS